MKNILTISLALILSFVGLAQQKQLTLNDAVLKRFSEFYPLPPSQLDWIPATEMIAYVSEDRSKILGQQCTESESAEIMTLTELNNSLKLDELLSGMPRYTWIDSTQFLFRLKNEYFKADVNSKAVIKSFILPENAEHVKFNDQYNACAFILSDDLYVLKEGGKQTQVTSDGGNGIVYGQSVHRSEFGITHGMFWAPSGNKIAFYRMDESMVEEYPLVDITSVPASQNLIMYPMAGRKSHHVKLGIFSLSGDPIVYANTEGDREQYLTSISWTPDSKSILIGLLNRDQNHLKLNKYNATKGHIEAALFEEKHEKYVEPEHSAWFIPGSNEEFLWFSERHGYQHLYLYNTSGKLIRQITQGEWEVHGILGFDPSKNYLIASGTGETRIKGNQKDESLNGTQRFIYSIDFELGGKTILDSNIGTHSASICDNGTYILDRFTSVTTPLDIAIFEYNGKKINTVYSAEDPLAEYQISKPELFTIQAADGQSLYARMIKPSHFDATKKYPVLVYVYGGPHAQLVQDRYLGAAPLWMYWMAEQGFIVATVDNRGSANRGLEFEQATFRNLGTHEVMDQKNLVDHLKLQEYVDADRFAVHGWSYGGFMTINMMLTNPGMFQAGVAGGPVCDWSLYEVMYTERYMDTPEANPEGFEASNLTKRVQNLEDDLLVIHGTVDDVVVWQHSQSFVKACVDAGIQLDYFIYPEHPHNVRGKDRLHLMEKVLGYVDDKIGPGTK